MLSDSLDQSSVLQSDPRKVGQIVGIDIVPELVDIAEKNLKASANGSALLSEGVINLLAGNGREVLKNAGPYDVIHVGAFVDDLPISLVEQLRSPGAMFVPLRDANDLHGWGHLWLVEKDEQGQILSRRLSDTLIDFVPLI